MADVETNGTHEINGAATGGVLALLRWEGVSLFIGSTLFYLISGAPWTLYAVLFLAPDLSFLAYLAGPRVGAFVHNALHVTIGPLLLVLVGLVFAEPILGSISLIWLAHIGLDRGVGYGLKYAAGFGFTHLGRIGKNAAKVASKA